MVSIRILVGDIVLFKEIWIMIEMNTKRRYGTIKNYPGSEDIYI
jgi:hypothetical protein